MTKCNGSPGPDMRSSSAARTRKGPAMVPKLTETNTHTRYAKNAYKGFLISLYIVGSIDTDTSNSFSNHKYL